MKHITRFFLTLTLLFTTTTIFSKSLENVDSHGVGIQGYDPVAYFADNKPEKGIAQFQSSHEGVIYYFASAEHKATFDSNPTKFVPQFGGFCAYGVSKGSAVEIDPTAFQIVDGRLLLQYSHGVLEKFNKDSAGNLKKADANWPVLLEKKGK
jgi:YHS domain-containing protein